MSDDAVAQYDVVGPAEAPARPRRASMRSFSFWGKIAATVVAFVLVARSIDPAVLNARVKTVDVWTFVLAAVLMAVQIPLVAWRWRLIVDAMNHEGGPVPGMAEFLRITYTAQFFGQVLPSVAGDGLRVVMLRNAGPSLRVAFKSTLLDRATAALALLVLTLPTALASPVLSAVRTLLWPAIGMVTCGLCAAAAAIVWAPALHRIGSWWRYGGAVTETLMDLRAILASRKSGPAIVVLCFLVHALSIFVFWLLAQGENLTFEMVDAVAVVPLVLLVSMAPIASGGWGLREGFVVLLFAASGVGRESALLLSLSFGTAVLLASLPGLVFMVLSALPSGMRLGRLPKGLPC